MALKNNSIVMWKRRLVAEFIHDKKKGVILLVLLVLAIFFVGKLVVNGGPDQATAAAGPQSIVSPKNPIDPGLNPEALDPNAIKSQIQPAKRISSKITRDIFLPNASIPSSLFIRLNTEFAMEISSFASVFIKRSSINFKLNVL